jgi:putative ABC transport system permease protein
MSWKPDRSRGLRTLLWGERVAEDVAEEFAHHMESLTADLVAAGVSEAEARAEAARRFGDVSRLTRETVAIDESLHREQRRAEHLFVFLREIRLAFRALRRSPAFAAAAILTLGLGIGATTAIYTLLDAVVLRPLPYAEAEDLVKLWSHLPGLDADARWGLSEAGYHHFGSTAETLSGLAVMGSTFAESPEVTITGGFGAERARAALVSPSLFDVLRIEAARGRTLEAADSRPGAPLVAVLGHEYWQRRFGGVPVVGDVVEIESLPHEIVGILPAGIHLPDERVDVWLPAPLDPEAEPVNFHWVSAIGRLAPGATLVAAQAELDAATVRLAELYPQEWIYGGDFMERTGFRTEVVPLHAHVVGEMTNTLWVLLGAVFVVLLIAGANVANLFLVRLETRRREVALRAALGARRVDLAWHHLGESVLIAAGAMFVALLLTLGALHVMMLLAPPHFPRLGEIELTGRAVVVMLGLAATAALVFGVMPLIQSGARPELLREASTAMQASPRRRAARSSLVVAQTALALVLLAAGGLMLASFQRLRSVELGFEPAGALTFELAIPYARYQQWDKVAGFYQQATEALNALPGVAAAGALSERPMRPLGCATLFAADGATTVGRAVGCVPIMQATPDAFAALGMQVRGEPSDWGAVLDGAGGLVVTRTLADRLWPGEDPIGKGLRGHGARPPYYRVVAVTEPLRLTAVDAAPLEAAFFPFRPMAGAELWGLPLKATFVVRSAGGDPFALAEPIRGVIAQIDAQVPVSHVRGLDELVTRSPSMARASFTLILLLVAGVIALLLSTVGIYGVIAYLVAQRTGEIGLRIALGAGVEEVRVAVVRQSMVPVVFGLAIGLAAALAGTRVLQSLLFGVSPTEPRVFAAALLLLLAVAMLASYLPARRAAQINPMSVLRTD